MAALPAPLISTARLALRELVASDAPFILALLNEPAFIRNIRDSGLRTVADAERYIETGARASYAKHGYGGWLVASKDSGEALGICGMYKRDNLDAPDVGFAFMQPHWKKGYAREAAAAVLQYARDELGITRVLGIVSPSNEASVRVLEAIGLREQPGTHTNASGEPVRLFATPMAEPSASASAPAATAEVAVQ